MVSPLSKLQALEQILSYFALGELQKQGQMGSVNRGQRIDQQPGMVQGRRQGMPPPVTPEGRDWQPH